MKAVIFLCLILLLPGTVVCQPIFQQIIDWLSGNKNVPPQSYETTEQAQKTDNTGYEVHFTPEDWVVGSGGDWEYKVGSEAVDQQRARYICQQLGGSLAEVGDEVLDVAATSPSHYWVIQPLTSSTPVLFSSKPRTENCWVLLAGERHAVARDCSGARQGSFGIHAMCRRRVQSQDVEPEQCTVLHARLPTSQSWFERVDRVESAAACHQHCLDTRTCQYWSLASSICLLYQTDGTVERETGSVVGTVSRARGCMGPLHTREETRVEYCDCITPSHSTLGSGYLDPRALPQGEDQHLGHLLAHRKPCPWGQDLVCTDDHQHHNEEVFTNVIDTKKPTFSINKPNITTCLVYDVRLSVGGHMQGGVPQAVASPQACHSLCLARQGCNYWTWRGDSTKKCFLRRDESRMMRRSGAAAGTTLAKFGCNKQLEEQVEAREEVEECGCREEYSEEVDLVATGQIDPRSLGRIVNKECKKGWVWTCGRDYTEKRGPKLFTGSLQGGGYRAIDSRSIPLDKLEGEDSNVAFPSDK